MQSKQIVCLANSRKIHGRCIAGREWSDNGVAGAWIRPVSNRSSREVSEYERQYENGSDPCVLDILVVPLVNRVPDGFQTENWLLHDEYYWGKAGEFSRHDLPKLLDTEERLWIDGDSTYNGLNDRISLELTNSLTHSLRLIRVEALTLSVFAPGEAFGNSKRRVQGRFKHSGQHYALWVTDPSYETKYLGKLNGNYALGACYLTISLGEPYEGSCYKLIASIIESELD